MRKDVLEDAASQFVACTAGSSGMTRLETFSTHVTVLRFGCGGRPPPRLASAWCGQLRYLRWLARPGANATSLDISIHLAKTQARKAFPQCQLPPTGYLHGCCAVAKARAFRGSELDQRSRQCDPTRRACAEFCAGLASGVSTRQLRLCSPRRAPAAHGARGVAQGRG